MTARRGGERRWAAMELVRRLTALVSFALVARALGVDEFAAFVLLSTAFSVLLALTQGSLDRLLVRLWLDDREAAWQVVWWSVLVTAGTTVAAAAVATVASGGRIGLAALAYGGGAAFVVAAWSAESRARAQARLPRSNAWKSAMEIGPAIARAVAAVAFADLLAVSVASLLAAAPVGILALRRLQPPRRAGLRAAMGVVAPSAGIGLLSAAYWRIDVFLMSLLTSPAVLAGYAIAVKGLEVALVIPSVFGQLTISDFVRERGTRGAAWRRGMRLFGVGVALAVAGVAGAWIAADLVGELLRKTVEPEVVALLAAVLPAAFLGAVLGNELYASGRESELLRVLAAMVAANVAMNLLLIPVLGAPGAALTTLLTEVGGVAWLWRRSARRGGPLTREAAA